MIASFPTIALEIANVPKTRVSHKMKTEYFLNSPNIV